MIKYIKLQVETDEQNQYVLNKLIDVNKGFAGNVSLNYGYDTYYLQNIDFFRAVCSVWKGFRHLIIDKEGHLVLCAFEDKYNERKEKEITFEEFKEMVDPKDVIEVNGVKYKKMEEE